LTAQRGGGRRLTQRGAYRRDVAGNDFLVEALARSVYQELRGEIAACLDLPGTPVEVIRALTAAQVRWADQHPNLYRFLVSRGYQRKSRQPTIARSDLAAEIAAVAERYFPRLADDFDIIEAMLVGLVGLLDASILRWLGRPVGSREQFVDRLAVQAWLIVDHHLRKVGIHVHPALSLEGCQGRNC
jgi:hypothetical protein